jgi:Relaxase/Mobilisation nuclease domain
VIGKISIGKSFKGCINYCLNDKTINRRNEEKLFKNRAQILSFNQCFGDSRELIEQFNEVRLLNRKLSKPVLHITLSFAPGEKLPSNILTEIAQHCAENLGFEKNQFISVKHLDTGHQHIHIVANRIDFDGKTWKDGNNYKKIADFCRKMEMQYQLKQVLNPRRFLPNKLQNTPRFDKRKRQLAIDIKLGLSKSKDFREFEANMKTLKYEVIKSRGIAFKDQKKVYTKGSDVGYSLSKITSQLNEKVVTRQILNTENPSLQRKDPVKITCDYGKNLSLLNKPFQQNLMGTLMNSENVSGEITNTELLKEARKPRKRKGQRL